MGARVRNTKVVIDMRRGDIADYPRSRLRAEQTDGWSDWFGMLALKVPREVTVAALGADGKASAINPRVRIHRYAAGGARLVAFERNIDYQMSEELKQAGGNEALEKPVGIEVKLTKAAHVYDLRTQKYLGLKRTGSHVHARSVKPAALLRCCRKRLTGGGCRGMVVGEF